MDSVPLCNNNTNWSPGLHPSKVDVTSLLIPFSFFSFILREEWCHVKTPPESVRSHLGVPFLRQSVKSSLPRVVRVSTRDRRIFFPPEPYSWHRPGFYTLRRPPSVSRGRSRQLTSVLGAWGHHGGKWTSVGTGVKGDGETFEVIKESSE